MPRVAPITGKSDVPAQYHPIVDEVLKVFGNVRGPFSMLLHSPKLAEKMLAIGSFYRDESVVAGKDRSLAILAPPSGADGQLVSPASPPSQASAPSGAKVACSRSPIYLFTTPIQVFTMPIWVFTIPI